MEKYSISSSGLAFDLMQVLKITYLQLIGLGAREVCYMYPVYLLMVVDPVSRFAEYTAARACAGHYYSDWQYLLCTLRKPALQVNRPSRPFFVYPYPECRRFYSTNLLKPAVATFCPEIENSIAFRWNTFCYKTWTLRAKRETHLTHKCSKSSRLKDLPSLPPPIRSRAITFI